MCCIFTCCGWVIDLIQRLWTFTMACCISMAVCCAILIACMSGIALGYNYSLAEYIDLKETNVSVYLKRGVFDDEIADDMEWRRSGPHQNLAGHLGDNNGNMITADSNDEMPMRRSGSVRKLDDSIFQSDDHHRFEGSLIKLTQKPLFTTTVSTTDATEPTNSPGEQVLKVPVGSLDHLKEIQAIINRRKMENLQRSTEPGDTPPPTLYYEKDPYALANFPNPAPMVNGRRMMMPPQAPYHYKGSARDAVPSIINPQMWANPHLPPEKRITVPEDFGSAPDPVLPGPVKLKNVPLRPYTLPESMDRTGYEIQYPPPPPTTTAPQWFPQNVLPGEKSDTEMRVIDNSIESDIKDNTKKPGGIIEEYEDDIKGLPVRKRRHVIQTPRNLLYPIIFNTPEADGLVETSVSDRKSKSSIRYKATENVYATRLLQIVKKSYDVLFAEVKKQETERVGIEMSNDVRWNVLSAENLAEGDIHKTVYKLGNEKQLLQQPAEVKGREH